MSYQLLVQHYQKPLNKQMGGSPDFSTEPHH